MTTKEAIEALSLLRIFDAPDLNEAVKMAASALRDQATTLPNDPLTTEELREMEGDPVWLRGSGLNRWYIFDGFSFDGIAFFTPEIGYGKLWAAYRRRPEEGMM